jgi:hypothetical protein
MNRRNFLRSMLGVAAATALPSEIWPFRKIFLPMTPRIIAPAKLTVEDVVATELVYFSKEIPELYLRPHPFYQLLNRRERRTYHEFLSK